MALRALAAGRTTSLKRYKPFGCDQAKSRGHETFEADRSSRIFAIVANIPTSLSLSIIVKHAGFTPKAVPVKILFPLPDGASLEEDENLHDMWAALSANAASPENADSVRQGSLPSFGRWHLMKLRLSRQWRKSLGNTLKQWNRSGHRRKPSWINRSGHKSLSR